ncbi:ring-infected erythrocyte surface antigen-like [Schistocerca nitens]|uniref:ring-infected erythrocyte surface antigen-like n=1 Tax=Schistocerca nitens TaxID=7011 RepID=UPI002117CD1F|nr:ring-infected erythrocyte surface antigen-like [Schistocerca nitens]
MHLMETEMKSCREYSKPPAVRVVVGGQTDVTVSGSLGSSSRHRIEFAEMECNLRKAIREVPKRLKMNVDERESKLQTNIEQVQGDVEKTEEELTKKTEENVEENRTEMGEKNIEVTQMQKQCDDVIEKIEEDVEETGIDMEERITEMTQKQNQCNDVIEGIGEKQKQLTINLRDAVAMQREDYQKGAIKESVHPTAVGLTCDIQQQPHASRRAGCRTTQGSAASPAAARTRCCCGQKRVPETAGA